MKSLGSDLIGFRSGLVSDSCSWDLRICFFSCKRAHECDHPATRWCHDDGECPPCIYPVSKMCVGEHMSFDVKNPFYFLSIIN